MSTPRDPNDQDAIMTTTPSIPLSECERFEAQLGAWLEQELTADALAFMTRHRSQCAACAELTGDLEQIIADAGALPTLTPPHDLWAGIASRLDADVVPLPIATQTSNVTHVGHIDRSASKTLGWSIRRLSVAAAALVTVTAGVTWQLANRRVAPVTNAPTTVASTGVTTGAPARPTPITDSTTLLAPNAEIVVGTPAAPTARLVGRASAPEVTYEREITALRRIVDERFTELDSSTVTELRRNLLIIDQAIVDSRKALAKDPRSAFVSSQLDRALQAKLDLMRRVALL